MMLRKTLIFIFVVVCAGVIGAVVTFFTFADSIENSQESIIIVIGGIAAAFLAGRFVLKAWSE